MIQVQRFNKALKLAVILGDLVILNVLFISFNSGINIRSYTK